MSARDFALFYDGAGTRRLEAATDLVDRPLVAIIGQLGFIYTGCRILVCIWNADGIQHTRSSRRQPADRRERVRADDAVGG